ncbi:MAG: hypothetical protein ABW034_12085 [Steroidobacteraceae bacterium]
MAEAEDLLSDVARHATVFARELWLRRRVNAPATVALADVSERLDLLLNAVFGCRWRLRTSQPAAPPTMLTHLFKRDQRPFSTQALPGTDGLSIWLPSNAGTGDANTALSRFRCIALQQGMRAMRGSAAHVGAASSPLVASLYHVLEAHAADMQLARMLPGIATQLQCMRREVLVHRPVRAQFPVDCRALEDWVCEILHRHCSTTAALPTPTEHLAQCEQLALSMSVPATAKIYKDMWTGELRSAPAAAPMFEDESPLSNAEKGARGARLVRRPEVRTPKPDEDDRRQGAWMVQTTQPHEHAEDPMGMQRPMDRDEQIPAEQYADSLSELDQARLVRTPGAPKEVLLSDDLQLNHAQRLLKRRESPQVSFAYPEWDYRIPGYHERGAMVRVSDAPLGALSWAESTLQQHRRMLEVIRRRFELLQAQRVRLRRQYDGDEIDLQAYVEARADLRAGLPLPQGLYQSEHPGRRELAICLLIDVSGSTDGWVAAQQRIIDVEREALLLVCIALQGLHEPYCALAFSGEGPDAVTVREIKRFDEPYDSTVAQRIAALEPERYTRAGAALRHATGLLMHQPARHRLLLLLSDGKPNDVDHYEGRYGVEDMRQAVIEAKLQGILPFCLTIDRQAAGYLPQVFGKHQYALLSQPQLLPTVLLDWIGRLISR